MASLPELEEAGSYRVHKIEGHDCSLVCEEDTIYKYISSGYFVPLRRYLRRSMLISPRDPRARFFAKSTSKMKSEENRHLERHYYMIHPFSSFYFHWLTVLTITHVCILFVSPILGMQRVQHLYKLESNLQHVLKMYYISIIIVSFFVGYYDKNTGQVILKPRKVARKYLCSFFVFDVLSAFSHNLLTLLFPPGSVAEIARTQRFLRMPRLFTINEYFNIVQLKMNLPSYICKPLKIIFYIVTCILWISYFQFIGNHQYLPYNLEMIDEILLTLEGVLRNLCLCDIFSGPYKNIKPISLYINTTILHAGKLFEIWLMAQMFQIFTSYMKATHRYHEFFYQIKTYIRVKDLPNRLSRRIIKYLNFKFQYSVFQENYLVNNLSSNLKNEILWHTCQNLVTRVETFKDLPPHVLINMVSMMKPEIYLPNDVVVNAGEVGNEMFFIHVGVLAVFTESGKEICHLAEGSHFGEIALLLNERRVASVVAIDFCQLYRLTKRDFQDVIDPYPSIKEDIIKIANERFAELRVISDS